MNTNGSGGSNEDRSCRYRQTTDGNVRGSIRKAIVSAIPVGMVSDLRDPC